MRAIGFAASLLSNAENAGKTGKVLHVKYKWRRGCGKLVTTFFRSLLLPFLATICGKKCDRWTRPAAGNRRRQDSLLALSM
jgi:hypothetical protein